MPSCRPAPDDAGGIPYSVQMRRKVKTCRTKNAANFVATQSHLTEKTRQLWRGCRKKDDKFVDRYRIFARSRRFPRRHAREPRCCADTTAREGTVRFRSRRPQCASTSGAGQRPQCLFPADNGLGTAAACPERRLRADGAARRHATQELFTTKGTRNTKRFILGRSRMIGFVNFVSFVVRGSCVSVRLSRR